MPQVTSVSLYNAFAVDIGFRPVMVQAPHSARLAEPGRILTKESCRLLKHLVACDWGYVALLSPMAGFLGATLINASVDSALGYATTEIGPHFTQHRPVAIDRRQTFFTKWAIAAAATPILTGILLLIAGPLLGMHAPSWLLLWALLALTAFMVATGTLALFAAFGAIGQLLAMILLLYLGWRRPAVPSRPRHSQGSSRLSRTSSRFARRSSAPGRSFASTLVETQG